MMITSLLVMAAVALSAADDEMHTTLDDYHDVDAVLQNPAMLKEFNDCFIEKGPCNDLTSSFKQNMRPAIAETCRRCNDAQKHIWGVYLNGLEKNFPQLYKEYSDFYDPKGDMLKPLRKVFEPFV